MPEEIKVGDKLIRLVRGDITRQDTCAIVNAANGNLFPGGGASGAIHRAAGLDLGDACRAYVSEHGPVATGQAVATGAGRLAADYVIHAVGPIWHGGTSGEAEALASAYSESVRIADGLGCETVAFPSISTGIFGYPLENAVPVALQALRTALIIAEHVREVRVVLFDDVSWEAWTGA